MMAERGPAPDRGVGSRLQWNTRISSGLSARNGSSGVIERNGSQPKAPPVSVRIAGEIEMAGSDAKTVVVRVNGTEIPAVVTGNSFSADLVYVNRNSMVSIEAFNSFLRYRALLGSAELLKRQAGADGRLDIAENPSLRVSPLSTAIHFFISRELGGRLPANDDEMDAALRALNFVDLAPAANMQRALVMGELSLPAGFANGTELLENRDAYRAFINSNTALRTGADAYLRSIPVGSFAVADWSKNWLLTGRISRGAVPFSQPIVQMMFSRPGGGFAVSATQSRIDPGFDVSILGSGDLHLVPEGQPYFDSAVTNSQIEPDVSQQPIVLRSTVVSESYRRVFVGKRRQLWLQVREESRRYPQYPAQPSFANTTNTWLIASTFEDSVVPFVAANVVGQRALPYFCFQSTRVNGEPPALQNCELGLHTMGANGVGQINGLGHKIDSSLVPAAASGSAGVQWRIEADGGLRIDGTNYSARLWRLGVSDTVADAMVFQVTAPSGADTQILAGHTIALDANQPAFFGADDPIGTWGYGTFDNFPEPYAYDTASPPVRTRFIRYANGTQDQTDLIYQGEGNPVLTLINRSGWVLNGLNLYDTRYRANVSTGEANTSFFSSCAAAVARGATQCAPARVRYFRPLAKVGNRWYGIEDLYTRPNLGSYVAPFRYDRSSRANYYDKL